MLIFFCSQKHSAFSTSYPIFLYTTKTEEIPDPEAVIEQAVEPEADRKQTTPKDTEDEDDSIEDVVEEEAPSTDGEEKTQPVPMKNVTTEEWVHLNNQPPLWQRYEIASISEIQQ